MAITCLFDQEACTTTGDCMECDRFPGEEVARDMVNKKRLADKEERNALVLTRDVTQLDPSQYAARVVTQWNEAVYGYGTTPDAALNNAEAAFIERYNFAVQYHEFKNK